MELPVKYSEIPYNKRYLVREEYVRRQNGLCYHCGESLSAMPADYIQIIMVDKSLFPDGFFQHPVHLHHSHETDLTIGAVHCRCNAVLWQYHGK